MIIFGSSGSGKTSFLKYYLDQTKSDFVVFGRDETKFHHANYIPLFQLENIWKTNLFRFGRHHNIQGIYIPHYAKDVLPIVRENCFKLYITINNPDSFFETIVTTYSMKELNWKQYRSKLEFGILNWIVDHKNGKY